MRYQETLTDVFSLLTVACWAGLAGLLVFALVGRSSDAWASLRLFLDEHGLKVAWIIALVTMLGSLYYSEIAEHIPCRFCWFQRITLYPLAVILLVAILVDDRKVKRYVVPLCAISSLLSTYHILLERGVIEESGACEIAAPCAIPPFRQWGFLTLAGMALTAAVTIAVITLMVRSDAAAEPGEDDDVGPVEEPSVAGDEQAVSAP